MNGYILKLISKSYQLATFRYCVFFLVGSARRGGVSFDRASHRPLSLLIKRWLFIPRPSHRPPLHHATMRLLRFNHDGSLSFINFLDRNVPNFAVLSHTWRDD